MTFSHNLAHISAKSWSDRHVNFIINVSLDIKEVSVKFRKSSDSECLPDLPSRERSAQEVCTLLVSEYSSIFFNISVHIRALKNPFLCPDGRVARGEGRLAQWGRTKFVLPHWAVSCIGTQKGANLCLKCVRMRLAAVLRPDPLGELERSPRPPSRNWGTYF